MSKALIVSGGGSKGAFAVGVIKELIKGYQLSFDHIVGTSTGALIAPLVAMEQIEQLEKLYTSFKTTALIEKYNIGTRINEPSLFTANGLAQKIQEIYTDVFYKGLIDAHKKIYLTTTCLQTSELVVFTTDPQPTKGRYYRMELIQNADHFRRVVMASASQPVLMPPVEINKNLLGHPDPHYQFVDGGMREYAGVGIALDTKATELFTILLSPKTNPVSSVRYTDLFSVLLQTINTFITDVRENDLYGAGQLIHFLNAANEIRTSLDQQGIADPVIKEYLSRLLSGSGFASDRMISSIKWHILQPNQPLGGGPGGLDFDPAEMKEMVATGQATLRAYVKQLKPGTTDWA